MNRHPRRLQVCKSTTTIGKGKRKPQWRPAPNRHPIISYRTTRLQCNVHLAGIRATGSAISIEIFLKIPPAFPCFRTVAWMDGLFSEHLFTVAGAAHVSKRLALHRVSRLTVRMNNAPHQKRKIIPESGETNHLHGEGND